MLCRIVDPLCCFHASSFALDGAPEASPQEEDSGNVVGDEASQNAKGVCNLSRGLLSNLDRVPKQQRDYKLDYQI